MNTLFSEDTKKWVMQHLLKMLVSYNRFWIITKIKYRSARKQHAHFDLLCTFFDMICSLIVTGFAYVTCNKLEPSTNSWISICQYIPTGKDLLTVTNDIYLNLNLTDLKNVPIHLDSFFNEDNSYYYDTFKQNYKELVNRFTWDSYYYDTALIIGQLCPNATIVRLVKNANAEKDLIDFSSSSSRFLEIEYKCGNRSTLAIEVPKSHYFAGNEILSKTYVLRYLEHLPIYIGWTFKEEEYSLRIVDEDSEVFSLNGNQYIRLERDGYKIVNDVECKSDPTPIDNVQVEDTTSDKN